MRSFAFYILCLHVLRWRGWVVEKEMCGGGGGEKIGGGECLGGDW